MITDYVGDRTGKDPICPVCGNPVETHHTPARDTEIAGDIAHDYCLRTETPESRTKRFKSAVASGASSA